MKIDIHHEDYDEYCKLWCMCRDAAEGQQEVHAKGVEYLPRLTGQTNEEYASYVKRTPFFNATRRTIDGLVGMVFRKYPTTTVPEAMQPIVEDFTLSRDATESIDIVAMEALREVLTTGAYGLLIEYPQSQGEVPTLAQAQAMNMRSYATTYEAEQIVNWRYERINNSLQLIMVALKECETEWLNEVESKKIEQIRLLMLIEGSYTQRVYRRTSREDDWVQFGEDIIPLMRGKPLNYIPFVGIGSDGVGIDPEEPPLLDLVNINFSHYRTTADLEHGAHFCGLPTAVITGYQKEDNEKFSIGSATAWCFPSPDTKANFLEFTGQGLGALQQLQKDKEGQMAALGASMLTVEKKAAEAEGTVRMRNAGETAVLASIAHTVSEAFTRALQIMADWDGNSGNVSFELNTDFYDSPMNAQELTSLVSAWQAGALSSESMFYNFQKGGVVEPTRTLEEEQAAIASQAPAMTPATDISPTGTSSFVDALRAKLGL